jgi:hypothetical protein
VIWLERALILSLIVALCRRPSSRLVIVGLCAVMFGAAAVAWWSGEYVPEDRMMQVVTTGVFVVLVVEFVALAYRLGLSVWVWLHTVDGGL